jgi:hypothetical protein
MYQSEQLLRFIHSNRKMLGGGGGVGGEGDWLRKGVAAAGKVEALCDGCFCFEF